MFSGLYIKLIASALVLAAITGGYLYVKHLQSQVQTLHDSNITLTNSNNELKDTIAAERKMNDDISKVIQAGDKQREEYKKVRDGQLKHIDEGVRTGKDRPVGPILKDFFNE